MEFDYKQKLKEFIHGLYMQNLIVDEFVEFKFESLHNFPGTESIKEIKDWYLALRKNSTMVANRVPLNELKEWSLDENGSIVHSSGEFFRVEGYRIIGTDSREVQKGWDQPFLTQEGFDGGILGLVRKRINDIPFYLVEAKEEPGNYNIVQISTTLQATFSNIKRAHKGKKTNFSDLFLNPEKNNCKVLIDQWTSEDGGRLFNKRNRSMLIELSEDADIELPNDRFKWITLFNIKELIRHENAIVAPHLRGIISFI